VGFGLTARVVSIGGVVRHSHFRCECGPRSCYALLWGVASMVRVCHSARLNDVPTVAAQVW